jgi:hypothetical protein
MSTEQLICTSFIWLAGCSAHRRSKAQTESGPTVVLFISSAHFCSDDDDDEKHLLETVLLKVLNSKKAADARRQQQAIQVTVAATIKPVVPPAYNAVVRAVHSSAWHGW